MVINLVSNVQVKAFVSDPTDKACLGSWENSRPPGALLKITPWGQLEASLPLCSKDHLPLGTANCPGQECCSFFHLIIPASQSPHHTLFIPWYKNIGLERKKQDGQLGYEPAIFSDLRLSE